MPSQPSFSHRNQTAREGQWAEGYSFIPWSSNVIGCICAAIGVPLTTSIFRYRASEHRECSSPTPFPLTQEQDQISNNPMNANIHTPTRLLLCRGWKALEDFGIGGRTPCLWIEFEAWESEMGGGCSSGSDGTRDAEGPCRTWVVRRRTSQSPHRT